MMKTCFASRWEDCAQSQSVTHCMSQLSRHSTASEGMPPHSKKTVESNPCTQSLPACLELRSTACAKASMRIITHTPSCSQSSAWGTGRTPQLGRIAGTVAILAQGTNWADAIPQAFFLRQSPASRQPAGNATGCADFFRLPGARGPPTRAIHRCVHQIVADGHTVSNAPDLF